MLSTTANWGETQIMEAAIQLLQASADAVAPDLDSIEYRTDEDLPEWMRGDEEQNNELTMYAQILAGAGIGFQLLAFAAASFAAFQVNDIIAFVLSLGAAGTYVWAVLKWVHARELPTQLTTFRSWKVNFVCFWVYAGVTLLNVILAYPYFAGTSLATFSASSYFLVYTGAYIGIALGVPLVAGGIFLGWRIKQLWLAYDPERSLAYEPFDYFIWEDEEPVEEPTKTETDTTIDNGGKTDSTETTDTTNTTDGSTTTTTDGSTTTTGGSTTTTGGSTTTTGGTTTTTGGSTTTTGGTTTTTGGSTTTDGSTTHTTTTTGGSTSTTTNTTDTKTNENSNSNTTTSGTTSSTTTTDSTSGSGIRRRKKNLWYSYNQDSLAVAY